MPAEFAKLLEKLAEGGVQFLVVGGVAVCLHGHVRYTADLDIIVQAQDENARRLLDVLSQWGEGFARELNVDEFVPAGMGSIRIVENFALDVFTLMRARGSDQELDYETLVADASAHLLANGGRVAFLSIPRLIELKTGTGRSKDAIDVDILSEIYRGERARSPIILEDLTPAPADPDHPSADEESDAGEWPVR